MVLFLGSFTLYVIAETLHLVEGISLRLIEFRDAGHPIAGVPGCFLDESTNSVPSLLGLWTPLVISVFANFAVYISLLTLCE